MNRSEHVVVTMTDVLLAPDWNLERSVAFMQHWVPTSFAITLIYLATVYWGQRWMRERAPIDGKAMSYALGVWNMLFSVFSGVAAYHLLPELYRSIITTGLTGSYCINGNYYTDPETGYWGWMFAMSKAPELGDTLFLILRKRPVIFMHWYHHALTFLYAQITVGYSELQAWCRWSLALNLIVHTIMYFYFSMQALRVKTPRYVAKFITTLQILQFVISCSIFVHLLYIKTVNSVPNCEASWNVLSLGALMYLSYLYLFAQFFYHAYIIKRHPAGKIHSDTGDKCTAMPNGATNGIKVE